MEGSLFALSKVQLHSCRPSNYCFFRSHPQSLGTVSFSRTHLPQIPNDKLFLKEVLFSGWSVGCCRLKPISFFSSEGAHPIDQDLMQMKRGKSFDQWDSMTAKFAGAANLPFLLLQLPQIILNARNLMAGNKSALLAVPWLARMGKFSEKGGNFFESVSGWTATLLSMWMPVAQMWTNLLNPDNIKGLSAASMLLAMIGNVLLIPRALFIRDLMWFTGSGWASVFYGWGNLICLYCFNSISRELFLAATLGLLTWIGITFWRDTQVYGHRSPFTSLKELVSGP